MWKKTNILYLLFLFLLSATIISGIGAEEDNSKKTSQERAEISGEPLPPPSPPRQIPMGKKDYYHPMKIPWELHIQINEGLDALFNLNFERAFEIFNGLEDYKDEHPMVTYGKAVAWWWYLSVHVLEPDMKESQPFLDAVQETIEAAQKKIDAGDPTGEAHLVMGGILGQLGRWQVTNKNYLNAYWKGKKAYKYLVKALEINPNLSDANMGKGIFDYYVATLPKIIQFLAFIGMDADKEVGLKELHDAAESGFYSRTPSKLFLIDIYARGENKPDKALEILGDLKSDYPNSPFVHILEIISYYNYGSVEKLQEIAALCQKQVEKGVYPPPYATQAHFAHGITYFKQKEWKKALDHFSQAIEVKFTKDAFFAWSYLYRGYCFDALGERKKAIADYKEVLNQTRRWESWDNAEKRLKKPFTGEGPELEKLTL